MSKRVISLFCSFAIIFTMLVPFSANAADAKKIANFSMLKSAFTTNENADYILTANINVENTGITTDTKLDGNGRSLVSKESGAGATIYQNAPVKSDFKNIKIQGNTKGDVGIWVGTGSMSFTDSIISGYNISSVNQSAIALGYNAVLNLNNTTLSGNSVYDISINECGVVNINGKTTLNSIHIKSNFAKLNIGAGWSGEFAITIDNPTLKQIGTVGKGADVSKITITNDGYYLVNDNGALVVKSENERAIRFDLAQRDTLYKGSAGFLYGAAEINVPSIDLLQGLKPNTMVQKAIGGLQHPTGDATRTSSALLSAGVQDMQVYFQDMYLEWPYDAPMNEDGSINIDSYQKSVESMIYKMVCDLAEPDDAKAFVGTDGNCYKLNEERASQYSYVLFNEPDQIWFGWNLSGLERAWKQIYDAVHAIDPNARCVGPNYSGYREEDYDNFLKYCRDNDCLPEIISWHELGDISLTDFYKHYDFTQQCIEKYYSESDYKPELMVNEYARHYDIGAPGGLVKWLSMFEDKDMCGCMAYWAMANSLNEVAADQNSPSSSWWVYHWYAQMTGSQCPLTYPDFDKTRFYGVASYDDDINMGYVLFGGSEDVNGTEVVYLDNASETNLVNSNGAVNVKLYGVSFSGQQGANYKPDCIFDGAVKADNNSIRLEVTDTDEMDAFFAVLTKAPENATVSSMTGITIPTLSYEAEDAKLLGGATAYIKNGWTAFATSGRADVGNINNNGDGVQFDVTVDKDGTYTASLFYALQSPFVNPQTLVPDANGQNRGIGKTLPYGISVDGKALPNIYLESTVTWVYKNHCDVDLYLKAGKHTITYTHINGNEGNKGNLQLAAAIDKLDLKRIDNPSTRNNFEIDLNEMSNFKAGDTYKVTAVAAEAGYYNVTANGDISLARQSIDYAADAKTYSTVSTYDIPVESTVYLSKGANTIAVTGNATSLSFEYDEAKTKQSETVITAEDIATFGKNPTHKASTYASSKQVVSNIGIGQAPSATDRAEDNYALIKLNAESDGVYNLAIRYTNDEPAPVMLKADGGTYIHPYNIDLVERYAQIVVNDNEPETVYFRNTMSWDAFRTVDVQVKLHKGVNEIKLYNDNSYQFSTLVNSTAPEIDTVTVTKLSYDSSVAKKVEHKFKVDVKSKPTCTKQGTSVYTCTDCGYVKIVNTSALGHNYATTKATPTKNGVVKCTRCSAVKQNIAYPKTIKLSATSYTYDGKVKKPTVKVIDSNGKSIAASNYTVAYSNNKNVGKASVKITFKGNYSGTKTLYFTINPKNTSISGITAGSKKITVKLKKYTTQTTGYQIQYATNAKFTSAKTVTVSNKTTSKTISKLAGKKKYYVRVRTYKTVGSAKYYSAWSKAKVVTTKK